MAPRGERSGRTLRLYLPDLDAGQSKELGLRFYATARGALKAGAGKVYEYYHREEAVMLTPARFEVK